MASNTKEAAQAVPVYSAAELAANHKMFDVNRDIVVAALRQAGKTSTTVAEAKAIIDKYKSRKVGATNPKKEDK